jgi:predicted GNAT family acetyltransferase
MSLVYFACTRGDFIAAAYDQVRWLDLDNDYPLARDYWGAHGQLLSADQWKKAHAFGYQYAAVIAAERIISTAGLWRFSEDCWEVAAVSTLQDFRRRGYACQTVAFVTHHILEAGKLATCATGEGNAAMIATAKSVGFQPVPEAEVWWKYPRLEDF